MKIINGGYLKKYAETHKDIAQQLWSWYYDVKSQKWEKGLDIKEHYATADPLPNNHAVFDIKGKKYRIVVAVNYQKALVDIRFIGTHAEYDQIDTVNI